VIRRIRPLFAVTLFLFGCNGPNYVDQDNPNDAASESSKTAMNKTSYSSQSGYQPKTDAEWKEILTPQQYYVTRQHGTERAGSSPYNELKDKGVFRCVCCGQALFSSEDKYESGSGWPSFIRPIDEDHVGTRADNTFFMRRTEVHCGRCQAHLGHVFPDGPQPTGMRYCMNGVALEFEKAPPEKSSSSSDSSEQPKETDDAL